MIKNTRYLKQVIVVRKDLAMPPGKAGVMIAHAAMTWLVKRLLPTLPNIDWRRIDADPDLNRYVASGLKCNPVEVDPPDFSPDEARWLTELDPGLEDLNQVSFAKIALAVDNLGDLMVVECAALQHNLVCHPVYDVGYSHNEPRTLVCIAIGPHWPEQLEPVTGHLKTYR